MKMKSIELKVLVLGLVAVSFLLTHCGPREKTETKEKEKETLETDQVTMSVEKQTATGLKTQKVGLQKIAERIPVTGKVIQDSDRMTYVFPSSSGTVQKILAPVGAPVSKGQPLFVIGGATVRAPARGTLISLQVFPGDKVDPLTSLAALSDTGRLRVIFDIAPKDVARVRSGQEVEVYSLGIPDASHCGRIDYLSPQVDRTTQTLKAGALIDNGDQHLKYGMFISGEIRGEEGLPTLAVPAASIQRIQDEPVLFVKKGPTLFEMQHLQLGKEGKEFIEVKSGVSPGEEIVTEGGFALKSEFLKKTLEEEE